MAGERPVDPFLFQEWDLFQQAPDEPFDGTDRVRDAIERVLTPDQRDVVNGIFYEQIPKTEIAKRLGIGRHEVRVLYDQALARLNEVLG